MSVSRLYIGSSAGNVSVAMHGRLHQVGGNHPCNPEYGPLRPMRPFATRHSSGMPEVSHGRCARRRGDLRRPRNKRDGRCSRRAAAACGAMRRCHRTIAHGGCRQAHLGELWKETCCYGTAKELFSSWSSYLFCIQGRIADGFVFGCKLI